MLEQAQVAEQFQTLLRMTEQAQQHYTQLSMAASDPNVSQKLLQLRKDKQRHIRLIERLLEIVN